MEKSKIVLVLDLMKPIQHHICILMSACIYCTAIVSGYTIRQRNSILKTIQFQKVQNGQDCASQIKTGVSSIKMTGTLMPFPGSEVKLPIALQDNLAAKITTPEVLGISIISRHGETTSRYSTNYLATFKGLVSANATC